MNLEEDDTEAGGGHLEDLDERFLERSMLERSLAGGVPAEITTNSSSHHLTTTAHSSNHHHNNNQMSSSILMELPPSLPRRGGSKHNLCTHSTDTIQLNNVSSHQHTPPSSSNDVTEQATTIHQQPVSQPQHHVLDSELGEIMAVDMIAVPLREEQAPPSAEDLNHIRFQRERRKQRQTLKQGGDSQNQLETMSRSAGSTISWAENDEVYPIESEEGRLSGKWRNNNSSSNQQHPNHLVVKDSENPGSLDDEEDDGDSDTQYTRKSISERLSQKMQDNIHHHYSALFGNDYSKKEGSFVLLAGIVMAFNSGFVNVSCVSGFLTGGTTQVVAGFAGPFANSSIALATGQWQLCGFHSNLILSYMAGACVAGLFTPQARPYSIQPTYGPTFLVGGIMLFMASILAALEADPSYIFYLTAGANGLQNGIASIYSSNLIRCSMTGAITDIALAVGQLVRGNRQPFSKAVVLSLIVFFFWLGGLCSYYMTKQLLSLTLFFNAALFWLVGIAWVVFLVKNVSISASDAILGTWQWKKTLRQMGGGSSGSDRDSVEATVRLKALFDVIDGDGNGEIDQDELLTYLLQMDGRTTVRAVKMLIRSADQDGDGRISRDEWEQMVSKLYV